MWLLSTTVMNRRDAVYGLKLFSPIAASYLLTSSALLLGPYLIHSAEPCHPEQSEGSHLDLARSYKFSAYSIIFSPSASFTYAFFQSRRYPSLWPRRRILPTKFAVRTPETFTLKICCTASLICVFVALAETSNTTVCCVSFTPRPFSVMIGRRMI